MNKVLKLLLCIVLSISVTYFVISNISMLPDVRMAVDFIKNGTEDDIVAYSKMIESDLRNSLKLSDESSSETTEKKEVNEVNNEKEEKKYETINELAIDYPMGTTYYSLVMSMGEMQVQILCMSIIFGIIIGVNVFMFLTDEKRTLKQIAILYVINLVVTIIATELVQILTLVFAYGRFAFIGIDMQFILAATAIFLFALAMNNTIIDKKEKKLIKEQEGKQKSKKKK